MNTFILAFSAQQSAISPTLEPNFTAKDAKDKKLPQRSLRTQRTDSSADLN